MPTLLAELPTLRYAEVDLEMKAKALATCAVTNSSREHEPMWRQDKDLMALLGQSPVRRHPLTANSRLSCRDRGVRLPDGDQFHDDAAVLVVSFGRYPLACRQSRTSLYRLPRKRWHYPRAFQENAGTTPAFDLHEDQPPCTVDKTRSVVSTRSRVGIRS
jgi:hypothetical protein